MLQINFFTTVCRHEVEILGNFSINQNLLRRYDYTITNNIILRIKDENQLLMKENEELRAIVKSAQFAKESQDYEEQEDVKGVVEVEEQL